MCSLLFQWFVSWMYNMFWWYNWVLLQIECVITKTNTNEKNSTKENNGTNKNDTNKKLADVFVAVTLQYDKCGQTLSKDLPPIRGATIPYVLDAHYWHKAINDPSIPLSSFRYNAILIDKRFQCVTLSEQNTMTIFENKYQIHRISFPDLS